jgi:hypothetical protein
VFDMPSDNNMPVSQQGRVQLQAKWEARVEHPQLSHQPSNCDLTTIWQLCTLEVVRGDTEARPCRIVR